MSYHWSPDAESMIDLWQSVYLQSLLHQDSRDDSPEVKATNAVDHFKAWLARERPRFQTDEDVAMLDYDGELRYEP